MKGIVYQIYLESNPDINYVGSTTTTLEKRWKEHISAFKTGSMNGAVICKYFKELGVDNFQIRVIKEYEVIDRKHLLAYEQLWINKLKSVNIIKNLFPIQNLIKKKKQIYLKIYNKTYYKNNREHISEVGKVYRINNREHIIEYQKIYYENNAEYLKEYKKILYVCPCSPNNQITVGSKARHERTIKHQKYLQSLEETKE